MAHRFMKQRDKFGFPNQTTVKFYPYSLQPNYVIPMPLYNDNHCVEINKLLQLGSSDLFIYSQLCDMLWKIVFFDVTDFA